MIDVSRKNLLTKESDTKLRLTCRELPTVALSHHIKIRENY